MYLRLVTFSLVRIVSVILKKNSLNIYLAFSTTSTILTSELLASLYKEQGHLW